MKFSKKEVEDLFLRKLRNSRFNRYYIFEFDTDREMWREEFPTLFLDGTGEYRYIDFGQKQIKIPLITGEVLYILTNEGIKKNNGDQMSGRPAYVEDMQNWSDEHFFDFIFEIIILFSGANVVSDLEGIEYKKLNDYTVHYYDIYVENYNFNSFIKQYANITIHLNDSKNKCQDIIDVLFPRIKDYSNFVPLSDRMKHFLYRFEKKEHIDGKYVLYHNGENGDLYTLILEENKNIQAFAFRNIILCFSANNNISLEKNVLILNEITSKEKIYQTWLEIRFIIAGAGDISYEKRIDEYGNVIGHNIYVEKEYETSYTKEYGDITFYINDGYKHKTELERFEDFGESEDNKSAIINDIPRMVMKALQTTKASRYLCYKLIDNAECVTLYFNGTSGDFYIKVSQEELMLHCRNMSICFTEKAEGLAEEGDEIIKYSARTKEIKELLLASYEMIYILAGAGEVKCSSVYSEEEKSYSYEIELEKEYEKDHERSVGNVSFIIKKEEIIDGIYV